FLPASFLTGFFGQNFGWMVDHLTSFGVFIGLGVAMQVVLAIGLLSFFRHRGWLSADATVPSVEPGAGPARPRLMADRRWMVVHPHTLGASANAAPRPEPAGAGALAAAGPGADQSR
ncbi:MAG TPA: CorA family divalent cation transporter, partial [Acidimicrobiales bacterium]|nr:CorA family divalent cation transporter [Acidimicrobiales bacterium]